MSDNIKKKVKVLKNKLKQFRKVASSDMSQGLELAKEIKKEISALLKLKEIRENEKKCKDLNKSLSGLDLYIFNTNQIQSFKKKWE